MPTCIQQCCGSVPTAAPFNAVNPSVPLSCRASGQGIQTHLAAGIGNIRPQRFFIALVLFYRVWQSSDNNS